MDNVKNDAYYVQKIKKDVLFIVTHMRGVDAQELDTNEVLLDSMLFRMIQISEKYIIYETLKNDMPDLLEMLDDEGCLDL